MVAELKVDAFFSIITVVYNAVDTIEKTIQSVLQQSYSPKEYIIIDGGSTDGTKLIIEKYKDSLAYWVSEPDRGIFDAMNKGISRAKGNWIQLLNAGDWLEPDTLSIVADHVKKSSQTGVFHGLMRNFLDGEFYNITGNSIRRLQYDMIQHPTCFIAAWVYEKYGLYDTAFRYAADYDFMLKLAHHKVSFVFIEKILVNFTLGGASSTYLSDKERIKVLQKNHVYSQKHAFFRQLQLNISHVIKKYI